MAKQVASLAVKLAMEADGLVKGAKLSKSELAEVRAAYRATTSPVDELDAQIKQLTAAFDKGAIPLERYTARLRQLQEAAASAKAGASPFAAGNAPGMGRDVAVGAMAGQALGQAVGGLPGGQDVMAIASGAAMAGPAGAAVAALAVGFGHAVDAAKTFGNEMARQFDQMDQWRMQAEELGTDVSTFAVFRAMSDDVRMSTEEIATVTQKMQAKIGAAAFGGLGDDAGKTGKALRALGIDVRTLAAQQPDQQLRTIAAGFAKIQSPAEQSALALDIFGKQGQKLLPVLKGGAEAFDEYAAKSETLKDALSKSEGVKALDDQLDTLKLRFSSLAAVAVSEVTPGLAELVKAVNEFAASKEAVDLIRGLFVTMGEAAKGTAGAVRMMTDENGGFRNSLDYSKWAMGGFGVALGWLGKEAVAAGKEMREANEQAKKLAAPKDTDALAGAKASVDQLSKSLRSAMADSKITAKEIEQAERALAGLTAATAASGIDVVGGLKNQIAAAKAMLATTDAEKAVDEARKYSDSLREQIDLFGLVGEAAKIAAMERQAADLAAKGASEDQLMAWDEQIDRAKELAETLGVLKEAEEDRKRIQSIQNKRVDDADKYRKLNEQLQLAAELFPQLKVPDAEAMGLAKMVADARAERDRIQELLGAELLSPDAATAALAKIQRDLDAAFAKQHVLNVTLPKTLGKDSAELFDFLAERLDAAQRKAFAAKAPQLDQLQNPLKPGEALPIPNELPVAEKYGSPLPIPKPAASDNLKSRILKSVNEPVADVARYDLERPEKSAVAEKYGSPLPSDIKRLDLESQLRQRMDTMDTSDLKSRILKSVNEPVADVARYDLEAPVKRYDLEMPGFLPTGTTTTTPVDDRIIEGLAAITAAVDKLRQEQSDQFREQQRSDADSITVEEVSIV